VHEPVASLGVIATVLSLLIMPVLGVTGFYLLLWRPSGRRLPVRRDDYLRAPPDDSPPAVVAMLFASTPGTDGLIATLLDLVRRGVIGLNAIPGASRCRLLYRDDTVLTRNGATDEGMLPFEDRVLGLVFLQERREISVAELRAWWQEHPTEAEHWYVAWWRSVKSEAVSRGLLRGDPRRWIVFAVIYGAALAFLSVAAARFIGFGALTGFVAGMALSVWGSRHVSPLTPRGTRLRSEYARLRNYLRDFGRLSDQPPEAVAVWEEYLPLALVLGEGAKALEALDVTATRAPFTPWIHDPVGSLDLGDVLKADLPEARRSPPAEVP
jgi:Predicted membrane protein (DUF2207) C-terminal domain